MSAVPFQRSSAIKLVMYKSRQERMTPPHKCQAVDTASEDDLMAE